jgi:hypothetical protein
MSDPLYDIALAAADLKLASPREFDRLLEAFRKLEERYRVDLYAADASSILAAQGRAVTAANIRTKLETCLQIRSQVETKRT